jgi:CRP-like cAMP-binding protein
VEFLGATSTFDDEGSTSARLSLPRAPSGDGTHYRLVATRGAGELVGDIGVVTDRDGRLSLTAAPSGGHSGLTPSASMASLSDSETPKPDEPPEGTPIDEWASIVLAKRFGRRWAGRTRVATLRAVTAVEAVSLQRDTLRWVIEHDEHLAREVEAYVKNQPGGSVHGCGVSFAALVASAGASTLRATSF